MKKTICHITTVHSENDIRIFHKQCTWLAKAGYDVIYVCPGINDSIKNGVKISGSGVDPSWSRKRRMTEGCKKTIRKAIGTKAAVFHIHDPELTRFIPLLKKTGARIIYDSHEHFPMQIREKEWIPSFLRPAAAALAGLIELHYAIKADMIIAVADKTAERFSSKGKVVTKIENLPILSEFSDIGIDYALKMKNRKICYAGAVWNERGFDTMCVAAGKIQDMIFEIVGRIDNDDYESHIKKAGANIVYSGYLDRLEIRKVYEESICGVCLFKPYPNNMIDTPTKIYEYMAAGIPVISSDFKNMSEVVEKYECGICVDPLDIDKIRDAMKFIVENPSKAEIMGMNGRKAIENGLNWEKHSEQLLKAYKKLEVD